ncbi:MAG: hypothetical protein KDA24_10735 [Deltaproteobacteria bacterium]|nr:hypothetical protein [Deltaproteobacteria bacterium]
MRRLLLSVLPLALLLGCNTPVGTYRVDAAQVLEASCNGVDSARTTSWVDSLNADPATDMQIGSKAGEIQAQLQRGDGTVLYAPVTDAGDNTWGGSRFVEATNTSDALLGSDFSGLLEVDGICTFDLTIEVDLDFGEEGFDSVSGRFRATLDEADGATPCDIQSCTALFGVGAARTSSVDPGVQSLPDE